MAAEISIIIDRKQEIPSGIVLIEDVASLARGLLDAILRLIQIDLGYPCGKRLKEEAKQLASLGLTGVREGSGILQFSPLPIEGFQGRHPAVIATSEIIQGIQSFRDTGRWPAFLPDVVRTHLGAASEAIAQGESFIKLSVSENGTPYECKIDNLISRALREPESVQVDKPLLLIGKIYDLNIDNGTAKIDTSLRRVVVEAGEKWFKKADDLRWQRASVLGFPTDHNCSRLKDIQEIRAASETEEDGISSICEISAELQPTHKHVKERIEGFKTLQKDWDTYGSEAPSKSILDFGLSFIEGAFLVLEQHGFQIPETFVVPTKSGGMQFEWEIEDRVLELEITSINNFKYLKIDKDTEEEGSAIRWQAIRLMRWVVTGEGI